MLKTCTTLIVGIFEQICFDEVFLMALSHGSSPAPLILGGTNSDQNNWGEPEQKLTFGGGC